MGDAQRDVTRAAKAVVIANDKRARIALIEADIALQLGRYAQARALFDKALALKRHNPTLLGAFRYHHEVGDDARAMAILEQIRDPDPQLAAWIELQRGLSSLDRGDLPAAMRHYDRASRHVAGWWLIEEHRAEVLAATGRRDEADALYRRAVAESDSPELKHAWADVRRSLGHPAHAVALRREAEAQLDALADAFPAAMGGHALEHAVASKAPHVALSLAKRVHAQRPNANAKIMLAQALLRNGDIDGAVARIEEVMRSPVRTTALHATAFYAYARAASPPARVQAQRAQTQRNLALSRNPDAIEELRFLHE